jgi:hypothetical protein
LFLIATHEALLSRTGKLKLLRKNWAFDDSAAVTFEELRQKRGGAGGGGLCPDAVRAIQLSPKPKLCQCGIQL